MRLKLIACKALSRELCYLSALTDNNIDTTFIRQGYHNAPDVLRRNLQQEIDLVDSGNDPHTNALGGNSDSPIPYSKVDFDAILIGYGLCSNGVVGISSKKHRLVIPRGHDCITFFLGSKERYMQLFHEIPGCFWYTASWIENAEMPCEEREARAIEYYHEKGYDDDDIEFLLESLNGWKKDYKNAAYIKMPFFDKPEYKLFTQNAAKFYNWDYNELDGDMSLLERFISGDWNDEDFLIVEPGQKVVATNDERIIGCEPI